MLRALVEHTWYAIEYPSKKKSASTISSSILSSNDNNKWDKNCLTILRTVTVGNYHAEYRSL